MHRRKIDELYSSDDELPEEKPSKRLNQRILRRKTARLIKALVPGETESVPFDLTRVRQGDSVFVLQQLKQRQKIFEEKDEEEGNCFGLGIKLACVVLQTGDAEKFVKDFQSITKCPDKDLATLGKQATEFMWQVDVSQNPDYYFKEEGLTQDDAPQVIKKVFDLDVTQKMSIRVMSLRHFEKQLKHLPETQVLFLANEFKDPKEIPHCVQVFRKKDIFYYYDSTSKENLAEFSIQTLDKLFVKLKESLYEKQESDRLRLEFMTLESQKKSTECKDKMEESEGEEEDAEARITKPLFCRRR